MSMQTANGLLVLFGATGDLASRKLYPALYRLYHRSHLSDHFAVIGTARREWTTDYFRNIISDAIKENVAEEEIENLSSFLEHFEYLSNDASVLEHFDRLKEKMISLHDKFQTGENYLYYLSISPSLFDVATTNIRKAGITDLDGDHRVLLEKPFGHDLNSAEELESYLENTFERQHIYRIDHYMAKETVQDIWTTRYYNPWLNAIWNKDYIDHVQIQLNEDMSVGTRGAYYDDHGALLDMIQNHVLQVLATVGMEMPEKFTAHDFHLAKANFLKNIPTPDIETIEKNFVRGQYDKGKDLPSYRQEKEVDEKSNTETFVAGRLMVNLPKWEGVPFFFRTGKLLSHGKFTRVDLVFKKGEEAPSSRLTFLIDPEVGVTMKLNQRRFGLKFMPTPTELIPTQDYFDGEYIAESYENILFSAFTANRTPFITVNELKEQWRIVDPIRQYWDKTPADFPNYKPYSKGPKKAEELIEEHGGWIIEDLDQWKKED